MDETKSDIDMSVDKPEPGELVDLPLVPSKPVSSRKASAAEIHPDPEPEAEADPEPEDDIGPGDDSKASIDPEPEPEDEPELEQGPEPEPEAEAEVEVDSELQPPHRAEALDVLAGMEMRFAELRERLYADKMEEAAREQAMILDGTL